MEARFNADVARIAELEKKLAEAITVAGISDKRFEDVKNLKFNKLNGLTLRNKLN